MLPISIPARGEICSHLQCFDLLTYIQMNSKHKRWLCPFCNKRSSYVMVDSYFKYILEAMKPLREKVAKIDDKITMYKNLAIEFTQDNGKFQARYEAVVEDGICVGYKSASQPNSQTAAKDQNPQTNDANQQASTEASVNQTEGQNSQKDQGSGSQGTLGKRAHGESLEGEEPGKKKQKCNEDAPIELD